MPRRSRQSRLLTGLATALATPPIKQAQIAATIAALLGLDYLIVEPRAAPPLPVFAAH